MSRPSEILCFRAGICSCWTFAPRSRLKRWHVCCHAPLLSYASLFPSPLLKTSLVKMHIASNNALVQKTLHPPRIPKKSVPVQGKASSSADRGGNTPVVPRSQQSSQSTPSLSSSSWGHSNKGRKGKAPFSQATGHSGRSSGKQNGSGKRSAWRVRCSVAGRGLSGAPLGAVAGYRSRVLGGIGPSGRISRPVFGLSSSPRPLSGVVPDVSGGVC